VVLRKIVPLLLLLLYSGDALAARVLHVYPSNHGFLHQTGYHVPYGWAAMYRIHAPGYFIEGQMNGGEALQPGTYTYVFPFSLLPGQLGGLLSKADDVIRIEAWDATTHECLMSRTFQISDFMPLSKRYTVKRLTFSTLGRTGHRFEPRVFWPGISGVFLRRILLEQETDFSAQTLDAKAFQFEKTMGDYYLDRGFVVCRQRDGRPEDVGDAAIWTGLYAASQAWRYRATHSPEALQRMEGSLRALHELCMRSPDKGTMIRYIYPDGRLLLDPASKDTYTGFFFAVDQCLPYVKDRALRRDLQADTESLANHFMDNTLRFKPSQGEPVDLNPSFSSAKLTEAIDALQRDNGERHRVIRILEAVHFYFLVHGQHPWPELPKMIRALKRQDFEHVHRESIPFLNGAVRALHQLQRNVHKSAIVWSFEAAPYQKLDRLLLQMLDQLAGPARPSIQRAEDVQVLATQSLHALHFIKVAGRVLPRPNRYDAFYRENLWQNKALLKTAVEWDNVDEDLIMAVAGDAQTAALRSASNHLSYLALFDLIQDEKDPAIRSVYQSLFERQYRPLQSDYNAMLQVMRTVWKATPSQEGLAYWSLQLYPEDRQGKGENYWKKNHSALALAYGGEVSGQARDPLPLDARQRDPFIWQRSAHSLRGDDANWSYPPLDYLFVYWLSRVNSTLR
jgi:hypothetical protein